MHIPTRLIALRVALKRNKCDALVVANLTNVRYLTGYTGTSGMVAVTADEAFFITDFRYQAQAAEQVDPQYKVAIGKKGLWREAARLLKKLKLQRVGFEAEHTSVAAHEEVQRLVKPAVTVATSRVVEDLRLHKDEAELAIIRRAVRVIDECYDYIYGVLRPGLTELEVADELSRAMRERGASGPSFTTIVASGARSALPHGVASNKIIEAGDLVTIDMGAIVDGYCSDCTRTVCMGKPTREQQDIYSLVWEAQTTAAEALRPSLGCKAADAVARQIIKNAGYEKQFGHGLGHGVGLEIHEPPRLSFIGKGKLAPGMVVTSEPGVYIDGWGGVRIEDMLLITETGAETLTKARKPKRLMAL